MKYFFYVILSLVLCFIFYFISKLERRRLRRGSPFVLGVTIKFKNSNETDYFKSIFSTMATYIRQNEPSTLSYELYESDKEASKIFIFERYISKEAYTDIHRTSKEFRSFREKLKLLAPDINGDSYTESGIGFA